MTSARADKLTEAVGLLRWLYAAQPTDQNVAFDYIVVLHWAGDDAGAIQVFEALSPPEDQIPDYVRKNIASAYYRQENYKTALNLFRPLVQNGDHDARLLTAEILMRLGEIPAAQEIYAAMIDENPVDIQVYLSRAAMLRLSGNYRQVVPDLEKASRIGANGDQNLLRSIRDDLASAYINLGESDKAIPILAPYIRSGNANSSIQGNYLFALRDTYSTDQRLRPPAFFGRIIPVHQFLAFRFWPNAISVFRIILRLSTFTRLF